MTVLTTMFAPGLQAAYAERRRVWTEAVGGQIATFLADMAERLRVAEIDVTDADAVAEHMRAMEVEVPE